MKELLVIPPERQKTWTWLAVAMFSLVGMGTGFYLSSALLSLVSGDLRLFTAGPVPYGLVACLTVALGFVFVLSEAGRPLRGIRALSNLKRSWMSREILFLLIFIMTVFIDTIRPSILMRIFSLGAAFFLLLCQGYIIYGSRGIAAWNKSLIPLLFLSSGMSSGIGLLFLIHAANNMMRWRSAVLTGSILLAITLVIMFIYMYASRDDGFRMATRKLRTPSFVIVNFGIGGAFPLYLLFLILNSTEMKNSNSLVDILALITGITMIIGGVSQKISIILASSYTRSISLRFERERLKKER